MDVKRRRKQAKTSSSSFSEEVSSIEWEFIRMTEQEEDLICRMYKLVGDRWGLIAGRLPGRKAEEIERFWLMRHGEVFASRRTEQEKYQQPQQLCSINNKNKSTRNSRRYNF
ncbi:MYB-like transcription factor ETC3 [Argentina anserina]|uniref:MYB-like transcription factor ETC3 n=1 Tax=Argentina anserina TaxID=57926 RepID=UPI0021767E83|nr:MYB-like transcription factor ETC3 [Potentilla anserina]